MRTRGKIIFIFFLILIFAQLIFSSNGLGLRTLPEATPTESKPETVPLDLRTIDPLLSSFRDGWKAPDLPGWKSWKIGETELKLPAGFKITFEESGINIDSRITDTDGKHFAQFYVYQLQSYQIDELLSQLMEQLFGNKATEEKEFEEYKKLDEERTAYLTRIVMVDKLLTYPVLFIYNAGIEPSITLQGTVAIFIFEPDYFIGEPDMVNNWISGIAGSYIEFSKVEKEKPAELVEEIKEVEEEIVVEEKEEKPEKRYTKTGDAYIDSLLPIIEGYEFLKETPEGWIEVYGNTFSFYVPYNFYVSFYQTSGLEEMEVADITYQGYIVSKIIVGYKYDFESPLNYLNEIAATYLAGMGKYTIGKHIVSDQLDDAGSYMNIYRLDYPGQYAWVSLYSKSFDPNSFGPGEYVAFIGLTRIEDADSWAYYYSNIFMSMSFGL